MTDLEFKHILFEWATLRLMAYKYCYYILGKTIIKDYAYDLMEKDWFNIGRSLGLLAEDETSPCIDFNYKHRLAKDAMILGTLYAGTNINEKARYQALLKKYKQL